MDKRKKPFFRKNWISRLVLSIGLSLRSLNSSLIVSLFLFGFIKCLSFRPACISASAHYWPYIKKLNNKKPLLSLGRIKNSH